MRCDAPASRTPRIARQVRRATAADRLMRRTFSLPPDKLANARDSWGDPNPRDPRFNGRRKENYVALQNSSGAYARQVHYSSLSFSVAVSYACLPPASVQRVAAVGDLKMESTSSQYGSRAGEAPKTDKTMFFQKVEKGNRTVPLVAASTAQSRDGAGSLECVSRHLYGVLVRFR